MGVKYLIFRSNFSGDTLPPYYRLVYSRLDGKVYKNDLYRKSKGVFFCRPKYYSHEDREKVIKNIKNMDYSKYVYIEDQRKIDLNYKDNMSCFVNIIEYTPNRVTYRYRANSEGFLTFPEAFDKGWSVKINGKETSPKEISKETWERIREE